MFKHLVGWAVGTAICGIPVTFVAAQSTELGAPTAANSEVDPAGDQHVAQDNGLQRAADPTPASSHDQPHELKPLDIDTNSDSYRQLSPKFKIWTNFKEKMLIMSGEVCLRRGPLEMFACPAGTKEHESVVKVDTDAFNVHVGLLAIGARPGHPARFHPKYEPAEGTDIDVFVQWTDKEGASHRIAAQHWVRNARTKRSMKERWVFAGSDFWTDEETGKRYYQAEAGDLICVSNFPTATMDLNVESSAANSGLIFEAFEERIPPRGTQVYLILKPHDSPSEPKSDEPAATTPAVEVQKEK